MATRTTIKTVSVVGQGNLGRVLAIALHNAGYGISEIVVRSSSAFRKKGRALAAQVQAKVVTMEDASFHSSVVWLCVPDDSIRSVANQLAQRKDVDWRGKLVLHTSGALGSGELRALKRRGAKVGSAHPMNSFVAGTKPDFRGIPFALEGDKEAVKVSHEIADRFGAEPFTISTKNKVLYHALGAFASPLLVSHLQIAEQVGRRAGIKRPKTVIKQILLRTMNNYLAGDTDSAFSGPLLRGDLATVKKHLQALRGLPAARQSYLTLARNAAQNLPMRDRAGVRKLLK